MRRLIDSLARRLFHRGLRSTQRRARRFVAATGESHLGERPSVLVEVVAEPVISEHTCATWPQRKRHIRAG
jgi:hypothetical protein